MKRVIVAVVVFALLVASCATNIHTVSYYPPGNQMYPSYGTLLIRVDTSAAGRARGGMSHHAAGKVIEQIEDNVFYIEDPDVQTMEQYIQAAFALDFARSNAFEIVGDEAEADYVLDITVDSHFSMTSTNVLKMVLAALLYLPTIGMSLIFMNVQDLRVENIMHVALTDGKGGEIYSDDFTEVVDVSYSLINAGYYNPSYIRIGLLKKIVTRSLDAIAASF